jgi:hypothetical protein
LIITSIATSLNIFELIKLLLPISQHMRLDETKLTYLSDCKISL